MWESGSGALGFGWVLVFIVMAAWWGYLVGYRRRDLMAQDEKNKK